MAWSDLHRGGKADANRWDERRRHRHGTYCTRAEEPTTAAGLPNKTTDSPGGQARRLSLFSSPMERSVAVKPRNAFVGLDSETMPLYGDQKWRYPVSAGCGGMEASPIEPTRYKTRRRYTPTFAIGLETPYGRSDSAVKAECCVGPLDSPAQAVKERPPAQHPRNAAVLDGSRVRNSGIGAPDSMEFPAKRGGGRWLQT